MTAPTSAPAEVVGAGLDATGAPDTATAADAEYRFDPPHTCELLATSLLAVHELAVGPDATTVGAQATPVLSAADVVERARQRVASGDITIDDAYAHIEPERLLEILEAGAAAAGAIAEGDMVLTHGRPVLSSLRCRDGSAVGLDSWAEAALADRHRDLAVAATSVASSLGPMLVPEFFEAYGQRPDPQKLDWWALAVQLTRGNEEP